MKVTLYYHAFPQADNDPAVKFYGYLVNFRGVSAVAESEDALIPELKKRFLEVLVEKFADLEENGEPFVGWINEGRHVEKYPSFEIDIEEPRERVIPWVNKPLRVYHIPQVGSPGAFFCNVRNEREACLLKEVLAQQHLTLYRNNYIPDYSNVLGVEMLDELSDEETGWVDYYNYETGQEFDEFCIDYGLTSAITDIFWRK